LGSTFQLKGLKSLQLNILINNLFNEKYENSGNVFSWYDGSGDNRKRNNDLRYFPQAGINVLGNVVLKF
jgi:iron complex outermembrane receptor protein